MVNLPVIFIAAIFACVGLSYTAPLDSNSVKNAFRDDLAEKFVEFMKQDQQLSSFLTDSAKSQVNLVRQRRDAMDDVENVDTTLAAGTEGFFDRAAKFVMEVLQRFLKWINTDDK